MVRMMKETITDYELQMNGECQGPKFKRWHGAVLAIVFAWSFVMGHSSLLFAQQPQAPAGTPLYAANAKYVNGMAPGYWATAGSGLTLNVSAGTAYCGNPPVPVSYPGGSLTLAASATNYVYLDPANNCAPAAGTGAFTAGQIPLATVVTGTSSITAVTDARTWFTPQPCVTGSGGSLNCSSAGTNQNITLTPSGAGASVITNLQDKGGQVFNIKAYGAKGDGATNDSPAFQAAYNAAKAKGGGTVFIPPSASCYLLSTAINMTTASGNASKKIIIEGSSLGFGGVATGATDLICANTGGILFDVTGSNKITFKNVAVTSQSGVTTPSLIGLYAARNASNAGAQGISMVDCYFDMVTHSSGSTYSFGAYLYGSEEDNFIRTQLTADYPLVVSATNDFSQNSAFITNSTGAQSETADSFTDMALNGSGLGPFAYFHGTWDMRLSGHGENFGAATPYPAGLYGYAIELVGLNATMQIDFRQEGFPAFAYIALSLLNSDIYGTHSPGSSAPTNGIEFGDASGQFTNDTFNVLDNYSSPSANAYYDASTGSPTGVLVLDNVSFFCGAEANCADIPVGNFVSGGLTAYTANVTWSASASNPTPLLNIGGSDILSRFRNVATNTMGTIKSANGAPTGACVTGSLYLRGDGGTSTTLYVCENAAWVAK